MIEDVESLRPELERSFFIDPELLEQRRVEIGQPRSAELSTPDVPESPGGWHKKSSRIEPLIRLAQNHRSVKVGIPVWQIRILGVSASGSVRANKRRERKTTLDSEVAIPLPAA